jgi:hypothetical protein
LHPATVGRNGPVAPGYRRLPADRLRRDSGGPGLSAGRPITGAQLGILECSLALASSLSASDEIQQLTCQSDTAKLEMFPGLAARGPPSVAAAQIQSCQNIAKLPLALVVTARPGGRGLIPRTRQVTSSPPRGAGPLLLDSRAIPGWGPAYENGCHVRVTTGEPCPWPGASESRVTSESKPNVPGPGRPRTAVCGRGANCQNIAIGNGSLTPRTRQVSSSPPRAAAPGRSYWTPGPSPVGGRCTKTAVT